MKGFFFIFMGFVSLKLKDKKLKIMGVYVWPLLNECVCVCHTYCITSTLHVYLCSTPIFFYLRGKIHTLGIPVNC